MQLKLTGFLFTLLSLSITKAQKTDDFSKKIDSVITNSDPIKFNGTVLVTKAGKVKYAKTFGYSNFSNNIPLKSDDQFEIMSNSKQVTAVLILKEVEKGNINLQSPIKKYLPDLTESWADLVTVHQLLNHTHGIVDTEKPLVFKPGSQFKYGNLSYMLLGEILAKISGKTYVELADELFRKLNMKNTFCYNKDNKRGLVNGYMNKENNFEKVEKSFINNDNLPAAGIVSTVHDLSLWNTALFEGGLLKSGTFKMMTSPTTKSQHDVFGKEDMGFGYNVRIIKESGLSYYAVTGLGDGFTCLNVHFPSDDVNLIILENQMPRNSDYWSYKEALIKNIILKSGLLTGLTDGNEK
ncbi:serine hydrolase domain-containing protein [Chryseobacterium shigense]|uniref:CubicO group peptidase (Beta-lactamase class C family) n=1 Tax=Chryseobacterium shigense TaxID=297244 RepID=A0A841N9S5_9FLAO|nr:serine hydrolase domain-containing protein [Chryseobacterium shigense]MBB6370348.1 CubicO group peptidase (beta-lactamase class C family) [Chryseobacterium shigense]